MSARPDVSVVITSYNTRSFLESCLRSVFDELDATGPRGEVIVVDDGSTDGSAELVASAFPQVRLLRNPTNQGYASSNNTGVAGSSGAAILLLNSDTVVRPGAIDTLLRALDAHPDVGAVGPKLLNPDGTIQASCWRFPLIWLLGHSLPLFRLGLLDDYASWDGRSSRRVDWITSAALMARRSVFERAGGFDARFGLYGVDVDWVFRARRMGYTCLLVPEAEVIHYGRASWGGARDAMRADHLLGHNLYFFKHYGIPGVILYRTTVFMNSASRAAFWGLAAAAGRRDAVHKAGHFRRMLRWALTPRLLPSPRQVV